MKRSRIIFLVKGFGAFGKVLKLFFLELLRASYVSFFSQIQERF